MRDRLLDLFLPRKIDFPVNIVDIGASIGISSSLVLRKCTPSSPANVVLVEGNNKLQSDLDYILDYNHIHPSCTAFYGHIISCNGDVASFSNKSSTLDNSVSYSNSSANNLDLPCLKLEDIPLIASTDKLRNTILIIEAEGSEVDIFLNASDHFFSTVMLILIEIDMITQYYQSEYTLDKIIELISSRGFSTSKQDGNCFAFAPTDY